MTHQQRCAFTSMPVVFFFFVRVGRYFFSNAHFGMKLFDWPQFLESVPFSVCKCVSVCVFYCSCSLHGSPSSPSTSGMLDGVTCDLLLAEMQAMRQGGPIIGVSCQDGAVCLCVCVLCTCQGGSPPRGWHILKSLMRLMQEEMGLALRPVER